MIHPAPSSCCRRNSIEALFRDCLWHRMLVVFNATKTYAQQWHLEPPLCSIDFVAMSVRVVARLRPLLKSEHDKDQIVSCCNGVGDKLSVIKIPNPKNTAEEYSFQFSSVYDQDAAQQEIFEAEGAQDIPAKLPSLTTNSFPDH